MPRWAGNPRGEPQCRSSKFSTRASGSGIVHGHAVRGARRTADVPRLLRDEREVAMALCGCLRNGGIGPDLLLRGNPFTPHR